MKLIYLVLVCWLAVAATMTACDTASPKKVDAATSSSSAVSTVSSSASASSAQSSQASEIFVDESECRAACHVPDPNETFAEGASPQPADHTARTTCLECHAKMEKHPLPATHTGRMDQACALCHKPAESK